jgi:hypothetical protein
MEMISLNNAPAGYEKAFAKKLKERRNDASHFGGRDHHLIGACGLCR